MNTRTSRRGFVKAAMAASLSCIPASAEESGIESRTSQQSTNNGKSSPQSGAGEQIAFPRVFTGRQLSRISRPLGGIGTGGIGLGGRGNLQDWQIFNRPDVGNDLEYAFPSLWFRTAPGASPYSAVLERRLLPPYDPGPQGLGLASAPGLPRLAEAKFHGSFPLSRIEFEDPDCPVHIALEAFSPFQPLDADASGLPCAVLTYDIRNPAATPVEVVVAWSISNPIGKSASRTNTPRTSPGMSGLFMIDPALAADDPIQGSFVLAALPPDTGATEVLPVWPGTSWFIPPHHFWFEEFSKTGGLGLPSTPSTPVGSVAMRQHIPAGGVRSFRFLLTWHFPNRTPERCGWAAPKGQQKALLGNYYCTLHNDAWAVAEYVSANLPGLEQKTRDFVSILERSTLPNAVKDAASANLSTLVSNTSFRIADGSFHGFEGSGDRSGLGFGSCTHVWNYEVATQFVFPSLARSMREISFGYATDAEGHMDYRHKLPLGYEHGEVAAADGQMGQIVKLYLDWILSGDNAWLQRQWPGAKRALAFAWQPGGWDERKSGVMDGAQHNTYDVAFFGPNPMCSTWYLAALRAMAQMADAMKEPDLSNECRRMFEEGSRWIDANLFNGEYYVQHIRAIPQEKIAAGLVEAPVARDTGNPPFQLGESCFVDQLIGQHFATIAGLGELLDPANIRKSLVSIYRNNYKRTLIHHVNVLRTYALNDQAGVVICDFAEGKKPEIPMFYCGEVWSGLEYSAAVLMITHGMVDEGLEFIQNTRMRYDGEKANPYDESEYGRHYARPMASWAAIPMLSGFHYDARVHRMELAPRLKASRFECFWSAAAAWGSFERTPRTLTVVAAGGTLIVNELSVSPSLPSGDLKVTSGGREIAHTVSRQNDGLLLQFSKPLNIGSTTPLRIEV